MHIYPYVYVYPPPCISGVPSDDSSFKTKVAWLRSFSLSKPLFEFGKCGVSKQSADDLCDMYRVANNPNLWAPQFNTVCPAYRNLEFAQALAREFDINIDHVLAMFKFGDYPGWLELPGDDMVFVQQRIPETLDELDAIVGGLHKSYFGKRKDKSRTSILVGPSTSPLAMLHAGTFPILKSIDSDGSKVWQCIYDCSNDSRRIVVKEHDYIVNRRYNNVTREYSLELKLKFPPSMSRWNSGTPIHTSTRPINKLQIEKLLYKAQRVDYSSLLGLRYYLAIWPNGRVSWVDLSNRAALLYLQLPACV